MRYLGTPYTRLNNNQNRILTYWKRIKALERELEQCKKEREISYRVKEFFKKSKNKICDALHTELLAIRDMICIWEA